LIHSKNYTEKVIIAVHDVEHRDRIIDHLRFNGLETTGVGSAIDCYKEVATVDYALAIVDMNLPDQNGLILSKYLRSNSQMRILMLLDHASEEQRLDSYESGVDMCLSIPFNLSELIAVVTNMLRRIPVTEMAYQGAKSVSWMLICEEWALLTPDRKTLKLTSKEFAFLNCLAAKPRNIVTRSFLLDILGYEHNECGNRSLESLVYRLRKKISPNLDTPIKTANGSGYSFLSAIGLHS
jgi:DNA-binding response OmpR family regulator